MVVDGWGAAHCLGSTVRQFLRLSKSGHILKAYDGLGACHRETSYGGAMMQGSAAVVTMMGSKATKSPKA